MNPILLTDQSRPYVTALIGNGEIVTTVGPTGYQNPGSWNPAMTVVVWAGRRMQERVPSLLRLGSFRRSLSINGTPSEPRKWEQQVDSREGLVRSRLSHAGLREETMTFVLLDRNAIAVITDLINEGPEPLRVEFAMAYSFRDDQRGIPPHSVIRLSAMDGGGDIFYEVQDHLGSIAIRPFGETKASETEHGWTFTRTVTLPPGGSDRVGFLIGYSDRRKYFQVPAVWDPESLLSSHRESWRAFQETSELDLGLPEVELLRRNCLYSVRCNCTPWSVPPAVLPTHWNGRTFHDELYPFLALLSAGHRDLAGRIPRFRLKTLDRAVELSGFRGARFPWETTETGEEGGPYGAWLDEHFHMGQFAESAWQWCLYEDNRETWADFFPLFRECAEYFALNLIETSQGICRIRPCTDYDETVHPVPNGLYTVCAAVRCLELAAGVADRLGVSVERRKTWRFLAQKLRESIPRTASGERYLVYPGAEHHHVAELGPVFPFRIDETSDCARRSVEAFSTACRSEVGWSAGSLPAYRGSRWMWSGSHLASAWGILGEGDRALEALLESVKCAGPGLSPCEQTRTDSDMVNCPWFTTAAGAFVSALHSLFVQVGPGEVRLFPALPDTLKNASFRGLAASGTGVQVSAGLERGKLRELTVQSATGEPRIIRIPSRLLPEGFHRWGNIEEVRSEGPWASVRIRPA